MTKLMKLVCASCGGPTKLDQASSGYVCEYCGERVNFGAPAGTDTNVPTCTECGGSLRYDASSGGIVCDNCGASFAIDDGSDDIKNKRIPETPEYILPFSVTEEQVRASFISWLGKSANARADIYDKVKILSMTSGHVPFYLYHCKYSANFQCNAKTTDKGYSLRQGSVSGTCESNREVSSEWVGRFNEMIDECNRETESSEICQVPDLLSSSSTAQTQKKFSPHYLVGIEHTPFDRSPHDAWPSAEYMVDRAINSDVSRSVGTNDWKDLELNPKRVSWKSTSWYVPMWHIKYSYNGKPYTYMKVADAGGYEFGSRPADQTNYWMRLTGLGCLSLLIMVALIAASYFALPLPDIIREHNILSPLAAFAVFIVLANVADPVQSIYKRRAAKKMARARERAGSNARALFEKMKGGSI